MIIKSSKVELANLMHDLITIQLKYHDATQDNKHELKLYVNAIVYIARYMLINKFILKEDFDKIAKLEKSLKATSEKK